MLSRPPFPYEKDSTDADRESRGVFRVMHDKGLKLDCTYNRPELQAMSLQSERPLRWLWEDKIPLGKLTLIEGPPAVGKLFVALDIAARVSTGKLCGGDEYARQDVPVRDGVEPTTTPPPNPPVNGGEDATAAGETPAPQITTPSPGAPVTPVHTVNGGEDLRAFFDGLVEPQERVRMSKDVFRKPEPLAEKLPDPPADGGHPVILVCDSWHAEDMFAARLRTLGADLARVVMFPDVNCTDICGGHKHSRPIRVPLDLQMFDYILRKNPGCRLIVIDNLENYCDSPKQLRQAIKELDEMAMYFGVAIVATLQGNVRIAPDGTIRDTARTSDGLARCIWSLTPDAAHPGLLRLEPKRMAFCKKPEGIACRISDDGKILWEPLPPYEKPPTEAARRKKLEQARMRTWLETTLGLDVIRADRIYDAGREQGFSRKMLIAARDELGARTFKYGFGAGGCWLWTMKPDSEVTDAEVEIAALGLPQGYTLDPDAAQKSEDFGALNENGRKTAGSQASPTGRKGPPRFQDVNVALIRAVGMQMLGLPPSRAAGFAEKGGGSRRERACGEWTCE